MDASSTSEHSAGDSSEASYDSESSETTASRPPTRKKLTKQQFKEKIHETMGDKTKFKEAMAKLRNFDGDAAKKVDKYTNSNQEIRRNALDISNYLQLQKQMSDRMSKAQKKKASSAQRQAMDIKKASIYKREEDVDCVFVALNGKVTSTRADYKIIESEDRWVLHVTTIGSNKFIVVCDGSLHSGSNLLAKAVLGETVFGPVRFMAVDAEFNVVPLPVKEFKALLLSNGFLAK